MRVCHLNYLTCFICVILYYYVEANVLCLYICSLNSIKKFASGLRGTSSAGRKFFS